MGQCGHFLKPNKIQTKLCIKFIFQGLTIMGPKQQICFSLSFLQFDCGQKSTTKDNAGGPSIQPENMIPQQLQ